MNFSKCWIQESKYPVRVCELARKLIIIDGCSRYVHATTLDSAQCYTASSPVGSRVSVPTHNGRVIPPWTDTGREYLVLERFPHLRRRLEGGRDSLTHEERQELQRLCEQRKREGENATPLHGKVSLLVGGNLAHVMADAVVNASNHWLTTGKGACNVY